MGLKIDYRVTDDDGVFEDILVQPSTDPTNEPMFVLSQGGTEIELSPPMLNDLAQVIQNLTK